MENYKGDYYNPETFEKTEIETKIPNYLVTHIKESLDKLEKHFVTPILINPEDTSVVFGVMNNENKLKYRIVITPTLSN
jgi:hypothetical protein